MKKKRLLVSVMAVILACLMVLTLILSILPVRASAATSGEIRNAIDALEAEADELQAKQDDLNAQIDENASETRDVIAQKDIIDQEIQLIYQQIDNNNAQIQNYNQLISDKQAELDDALARQEELNEAYKTRLRAMEENGKLSYWSILFKANSFLDLLDQINMIAEIAERDQEILAELQEVANEIQTAQEEMLADKSELETVKEELDASVAELDEKRAESDDLLKKLVENADELQAYYAELEEQHLELDAEIAEKEKAYTEALKKEEEANKPASSGGGSGDGPAYNGEAGNGFAWPSSCTYITSSYGYRDSPFGNGSSTWHTGIDIGASRGSAIYASKAGTVTTAGWSSTGYGNYVVINHGDGSSSLYGHMTNYIVSAGQYVSQGQVIGYVGSTGNSTGPHLHFTIYINGSTVNPLAYLP